MQVAHPSFPNPSHHLLHDLWQVVTELHLLQFGMLMGESSAELAVGMQGAAQPVGPGPDSLYGEVDCPDLFQRGWERIIEEHKEGLHYWVERRHLRKGLFMYKSRTGARGGDSGGHWALRDVSGMVVQLGQLSQWFCRGWSGIGGVLNTGVLTREGLYGVFSCWPLR